MVTRIRKYFRVIDGKVNEIETIIPMGERQFIIFLNDANKEYSSNNWSQKIHVYTKDFD